MLEFIFFHEPLQDRFCALLDRLGVAHAQRADEMGTLVIVSEDIDENIAEQLDAAYDELFAETEHLVRSAADNEEHNSAGIRIGLTHDVACMVPLDPDLMNRVLTVLSVDELERLVRQVALAVLEPRDEPVCHFNPPAD